STELLLRKRPTLHVTGAGEGAVSSSRTEALPVRLRVILVRYVRASDPRARYGTSTALDLISSPLPRTTVVSVMSLICAGSARYTPPSCRYCAWVICRVRADPPCFHPTSTSGLDSGHDQVRRSWSANAEILTSRTAVADPRSEERRVGKERRCGGAPDSGKRQRHAERSGVCTRGG